MTLHENSELFADAIQAASRPTSELPDLAYKEIPTSMQIEQSIEMLMQYLDK